MAERRWRPIDAVWAFAFLLATAPSLARAAEDERKKPVPVNELPADVVAVAKKLCPDGEITAAKREEDVDDQGQLQEFDFDLTVTLKSGKVHEVEIDTTPEGKVKPGECDAKGPVAADDLTDAILTAVKRLCPDAKVASGERRATLSKDQAEVEYELQLDLAAGEKAEVTIGLDDAGKVEKTRLKANVPAADVPKAVADALKVIRPGAEIASARKQSETRGDEVRVEYRLELKTADGKAAKANVRLTADGRIREIEVEDD